MYSVSDSAPTYGTTAMGGPSPGWWSKFKMWWSQRSMLMKILIIIFAIILLPTVLGILTAFTTGFIRMVRGFMPKKRAAQMGAPENDKDLTPAT